MSVDLPLPQPVRASVRPLSPDPMVPRWMQRRPLLPEVNLGGGVTDYFGGAAHLRYVGVLEDQERRVREIAVGQAKADVVMIEGELRRLREMADTAFADVLAVDAALGIGEANRRRRAWCDLAQSADLCAQQLVEVRAAVEIAKAFAKSPHVSVVVVERQRDEWLAERGLSAEDVLHYNDERYWSNR